MNAFACVNAMGVGKSADLGLQYLYLNRHCRGDAVACEITSLQTWHRRFVVLCRVHRHIVLPDVVL